MATQKPLSERKTGYLIATLAGLAGGPIGLLASPLVLYLLSRTLKARDGKQPNRFIPWALIGVIGVPLCLFPLSSSTEKNNSRQETREAIPPNSKATAELLANKNTPTPTDQQAPTLEEKIVVIDHGFVEKDDIRAKRIAFLLRSLSDKSRMGKEEIADLMAAMRRHLRENFGKEVKMTDLMEAANSAEVSNADQLRTFMALYATSLGASRQ